MFTVRRLTNSDAADFRSLRLEGLKRHPDAFGASYDEEATYGLDFFADRLKQCSIFGGLINTDLVGIVGFYTCTGEKAQHKGVLYGLYVQDDARGSGLAGQLVQAVLSHARAHVEYVQLSVVTSNHHARRFYEKFGFELYGLEPKALKVDGIYLDEALMQRSVV